MAITVKSSMENSVAALQSGSDVSTMTMPLSPNSFSRSKRTSTLRVCAKKASGSVRNAFRSSVSLSRCSSVQVVLIPGSRRWSDVSVRPPALTDRRIYCEPSRMTLSIVCRSFISSGSRDSLEGPHMRMRSLFSSASSSSGFQSGEE